MTALAIGFLVVLLVIWLADTLRRSVLHLAGSFLIGLAQVLRIIPWALRRIGRWGGVGGEGSGG